MFKRLILTLTLITCSLIGKAEADFQPGALLAPQPAATMASITGGHWGVNTPNLYLFGYNSLSDGGEGLFSYSSTSCVVDTGSCVQDLDGNYYKRTNLNGSLAQFGVTSGSVYDWNTHGAAATNITPILTAAETVNISHGTTELHTNGISVYMSTNYSQPGSVSFTCDGTIGPPNSTTWFNNLPSAVYKASGVTWDRAQRSTSVHNCYVAASFLTAKPTNAQTLSTLLSTMISNGDTGLICNNQGCNDHDLFIVGFDTGYETINAPESVVDNIFVDGDVCFWVDSVGGNTRWSKTQCFTYLTKGITNSEEDFDITKIENDGGLCKLTVTPSASDNPGILTDLQYANYIYATSLKSGPSSCEGQFKMSSINAGAGTFDLIGSAVLGPTTFGHWAIGSNTIYVTNGTNLSNGEVINGLDAQGIPTGTTVTSPVFLPPQTGGYITDTGGVANTYVANAPLATQPCKLADALNVAFTPIHTNTGASTLNITLQPHDVGPPDNGCTGGTTGPIGLVRQDNTALQANDLVANVPALVRYNATFSAWVLIQPKVILSVPTTAAQSANISITFTGTVCNGIGVGAGQCGASPQAIFLFTERVDAGGSPGGVAAGGTMAATCLLVGGPIAKELPDTDKVAGFQDDQAFCYGHSYEAHIQNSNETGITNFGTDSHGITDNPNTVILLVDGEVNNAHILGRKAGKGGRSIVVNTTYPNNSDRGCVTWEGAAVATTSGNSLNTDVEQGCLLMTTAVTNSNGISFVSNFASKVRLDVNQPNTSVYYESPAAKLITCTTGSSLALGQTCPSDVALPGAIIQVSTVSALQSGSFSGATAINLGGYYSLSDNGGGLLNLDNTCTVDNGNCFQTNNSTGDKYRRVSPRWDILEWGGKPDKTTDVSTPLTAGLLASSAANQPSFSMGSNTTGSSYLISSLLTIPSGVNLDCGAAPYVQPGSDDFRTLPNSLLLGNSGGIKVSGSGISNCNILKSNLNVAPPTDTQGAYTRLAAFTGTGVQCIADGCEFKNDSIIGFDTGLTYTGSIRNYNVDNVRVDANTCYAVRQGQENRQQVMDQAICQPLATTTATTGTTPQATKINLTSIADNGSGEIRINYASCVTTNCPLEGYQGWVVNGSSDQSIQGGWTLHNVTSTHSDLQGSSSSFIAGATVSMTTVSGSKFVTAASTLSSQVKATQTITGTGIPGGTTISFVEKAYNLIVLSAAATGSGTNNMTITDAASGVFTITTATVVAGGAGYVVGDVLTPDLNGGTLGTGPAQLTVATVDGSGAVLTVTITDGGNYTVIPGSPDTVTGGTGSGATFTLSDNTTGQLLLTANSRTGPCYTLLQTNDVLISNSHCYAHAVGLLAQSNTSRLKTDQVVFDDAGVLQDDTRIGIHLTGSASKNQIANFRVDNYFGHGVVDDTSHSSPASGNSIVHGLINSNANAGFNQSLIEVLGPASGTLKKSGFVFSDITSGSKGGIFIADDVYQVTSSANLMNLSTVYAQSVTAINKWFKGLSDTFSAIISFGTLPTVTGTGSPAIAPGSTNQAGKVTGGTSATSIVITFAANTWSNAPNCTVSPQTSVASFAYVTTISAITITQTATTGQIVNYTCTQNNG